MKSLRGSCWFLVVSGFLTVACAGPDEIPPDVTPMMKDTAPAPTADAKPDKTATPDAMPELPPAPVDAMGTPDADAAPSDTSFVDFAPDDVVAAPEDAADVTIDLAVPDVVADVVVEAGAPDAGTPDVAADTSSPPVPPTPCASTAECSAGVCSLGTCRAGTGLLLYWTFDDQPGVLTAIDSSGNAFDGTYTGNTGQTPSHTSEVAPVQFPNSGARTFLASGRHAARVATMPSVLKMANNFSVSAWYRVKDAQLGTNGGSEVLSAGDQYSLRVYDGQIEFSKRATTSSGGGTFVQARGATGPLDDKWHHIVGVTTREGMKVYLDGVLIKSRTDGVSPSDVRYDRGADFWVARHGSGSGAYDFNGDIDEVRVYDRVLTDAEIAWLHAGKP